MIKTILKRIISQNEEKIGVDLKYVRKILDEDLGLFFRYTKIFSFFDKNTYLPKEAYHAARLSVILNASCGTCLEAEINLAKKANLKVLFIRDILMKNYENLDEGIVNIIKLSEAISSFSTNKEARENIIEIYGQKALIELSYTINGSLILPGIKRTLGYETTCELNNICDRILIV